MEDVVGLILGGGQGSRLFPLTQFNSASLHRHISTTYRFDSFSDGFVEIMAAE